MGANLAPGVGGGTCMEIDMLEASNHALQTAIHTETTEGKFGNGRCDVNGCFARVGGPQSPASRRNHYASRGGQIDSKKPFEVITSVDTEGAITMKLRQDGKEVTSFDKRMAGNPQGGGKAAEIE